MTIEYVENRKRERRKGGKEGAFRRKAERKDDRGEEKETLLLKPRNYFFLTETGESWLSLKNCTLL